MDLVALRVAMRAQLTTEAETEEEMEQEQQEENGEEEEAVPNALESKVGRHCNEVAEDSKAAEEIEEAMKEDKKKVDNYMGAWDRLAHAQIVAEHPRC